MITDPISDMLTRIRNAQKAKKAAILVPRSTVKFAIAKILEKEGYVGQVDDVSANGFPHLQIALKYKAGEPAIRSITRISKPGRRVYAKATELPRPFSDLGLAIVSTPNGLMSHKEARVRKLGGEVLCEVY